MRLIISWIILLMWGSLIFFISSIPEPKLTKITLMDTILTTSYHFFAYLFLGVLFMNSFNKTFKWKPTRLLFWSIFLSIIYAMVDEYNQFYIPGRTPSLLDLVVDSFGVSFGCLLYKKKFYNHKLLQIPTDKALPDEFEAIIH